jgi:hypothetical protein
MELKASAGCVVSACRKRRDLLSCVAEGDEGGNYQGGRRAV